MRLDRRVLGGGRLRKSVAVGEIEGDRLPDDDNRSQQRIGCRLDRLGRRWQNPQGSRARGLDWTKMTRSIHQSGHFSLPFYKLLAGDGITAQAGKFWSLSIWCACWRAA